jgi:hypothetical protein
MSCSRAASMPTCSPARLTGVVYFTASISAFDTAHPERGCDVALHVVQHSQARAGATRGCTSSREERRPLVTRPASRSSRHRCWGWLGSSHRSNSNTLHACGFRRSNRSPVDAARELLADDAEGRDLSSRRRPIRGSWIDNRSSPVSI